MTRLRNEGRIGRIWLRSEEWVYEERMLGKKRSAMTEMKGCSRYLVREGRGRTAVKEPGTWNTPCYGLDALLPGKVRTTAKGRILKAFCAGEVFWRLSITM